MRAGGQGGLHVLRQLHEGLPQSAHRAYSEERPRLLRVLQSRERESRHGRVRSRLYRLRPVCESVRTRRDQDERILARVRLFKVRRLHEVRREVSETHHFETLILREEIIQKKDGRSGVFHREFTKTNFIWVHPKTSQQKQRFYYGIAVFVLE